MTGDVRRPEPRSRPSRYRYRVRIRRVVLSPPRQDARSCEDPDHAQAAPRDRHPRAFARFLDAARPDGEGQTLLQRLPDALDGVPVTGSDGSLWPGPKDEMRTTHQAYSMWQNGWYHLHRGEEVLIPPVSGAMAQFQDRFAADGKNDGVVRGRGHGPLPALLRRRAGRLRARGRHGKCSRRLQCLGDACRGGASRRRDMPARACSRAWRRQGR